MKLFSAIVLVVVMLLTGCATVDYFTNPGNQKVLTEMGLTCFQSGDVKAGAAYIIKKAGTSVEPTTTGEFLIGCDGKWFTVVCDFTKKPSENPCTGLKEYDLKTVSTTGFTYVPVTAPVPLNPTPVLAPMPQAGGK